MRGCNAVGEGVLEGLCVAFAMTGNTQLTRTTAVIRPIEVDEAKTPKLQLGVQSGTSRVAGKQKICERLQPQRTSGRLVPC